MAPMDPPQIAMAIRVFSEILHWWVFAFCLSIPKQTKARTFINAKYIKIFFKIKTDAPLYFLLQQDSFRDPEFSCQIFIKVFFNFFPFLEISQQPHDLGHYCLRTHVICLEHSCFQGGMAGFVDRKVAALVGTLAFYRHYHTLTDHLFQVLHDFRGKGGDTAQTEGLDDQSPVALGKKKLENTAVKAGNKLDEKYFFSSAAFSLQGPVSLGTKEA